MSFETAQRMQAFETLVFSELAKRKKDKIARGEDVIDLSIGSPDLPPAPEVIACLTRNIQDPAQYGYTLTGTDEFLEAVAVYYRKRFGVALDPQTEVMMTMGSQDGLVHLPMVFANPGDIILVPDPGYTAYETGVHMAEAALYPLPLKKENGFLPDLEAIPQEVAKRAKMMILNFPGNPVPALASRTFFEQVVQFAKQYNILVVHDFAYSELVFGGQKATSFLEVEGAKEVGVEFNSLSKSFNMAGCRIGYLVGNPEVLAAFGRLKSNLDYGVFLPIQKAAALALREGRELLARNVKAYEARRDALVKGLAEAGWDIDPPQATMFAWAELPEGWTSRAFAYGLLEHAGVVVTPGDAFGKHGEGFVRIALVQSESRLSEAARRIGDFLRVYDKMKTEQTY
ncbi:aminotransferase class I and II [Caldalkalibacillus thermarum TA2.A1]|uniref:Aminotransferase n=1 Tax=Caldalkalibacillus thermarum (strain TA2.A1) TaxID=986075 RepID=F5L8A1_CALTT|nr:LL-diaminopimelate aminotransferase [Caldalkalibacillus thermarum]EGL82421.1 aminotransferase class I and II [Caldalkalibacillus thermarum TA2.A1]QZT35008.1 LL-diaminopimelate aminotransferase [Caldalkalibacillus thermarum TA2.A1]